MCNVPVYANQLSSQGYSNLTVGSDLHVTGSIYGSGRMDVGATIYATFRPLSNISFSGNTVLSGGAFIYDWTSADMTAMSNMTMSVPRSNIFNPVTGVITVPVSGLYNLEMQGSFSNNAATSNNADNGVYYQFLNQSFSNTRRAAAITRGTVASTSTSAFLLAGDTIKPTFYSSDSNATLLANGESYVAFSVMATVTPTHSNYYRQ